MAGVSLGEVVHVHVPVDIVHVHVPVDISLVPSHMVSPTFTFTHACSCLSFCNSLLEYCYVVVFRYVYEITNYQAIKQCYHYVVM